MTATTSRPLSEVTLLKPEKVMRLLGYADRAAFWVAVKAAGIPFIRINPRRCLFDEATVQAWLRSRTVHKRARR